MRKSEAAPGSTVPTTTGADHVPSSARSIDFTVPGMITGVVCEPVQSTHTTTRASRDIWSARDLGSGDQRLGGTPCGARALREQIARAGDPINA